MARDCFRTGKELASLRNFQACGAGLWLRKDIYKLEKLSLTRLKKSGRVAAFLMPLSQQIFLVAPAIARNHAFCDAGSSNPAEQVKTVGTARYEMMHHAYCACEIWQIESES